MRPFAGSKLDLLNVAATRTKDDIYVIGNQFARATASVFGELEIYLLSN